MLPPLILSKKYFPETEMLPSLFHLIRPFGAPSPQGEGFFDFSFKKGIKTGHCRIKSAPPKASP